MKASSKKSLFMSFIKYMEEERIRYCVAGDTRRYPYEIPSDIDIIIPQHMISMIANVVSNFVTTNDLLLVQKLKYEANAWSFVICDASKHRLTFLQLDVCGDYRRNGITYLLSDYVLANTLSAHVADSDFTFNIPAPEKAFIFYLIKKISKREINENSVRYLGDLYTRESLKIKSALNDFFPENISSSLLMLIESRNTAEIQALLPKLNRILISKSTTKIRTKTSEVRRIIHRLIHPTGLFIAFLGPDGSGKSTTIESVAHVFNEAFRSAHVIHLKPKLNLLRKTTSSVSVTNPHLHPPRGLISSILKLIYFSSSYIAGYVLIVRPLITRSSLVIFDRYYQDILVDPIRYRYDGPNWLLTFIDKIIPKPELLILLDAPADVLQSRKQEVPYDESKRQREAYMKVLSRYPQFRIADASQPADKVAQNVAYIIANYLSKRTGSM